jgi:hypothetical protein
LGSDYSGIIFFIIGSGNITIDNPAFNLYFRTESTNWDLFIILIQSNISKSLIFSFNKLKNIKNLVIPRELLINPTKTLNTPNIITTTPNPANSSEITSYNIILCFRQFSSNLHAKTTKANTWTSLNKYTQNQENSITPANHSAASLFHAKLVLLVIRSRAMNKLESLFKTSLVSLNTMD